MHPIERLRYVARASGVEAAVLVRETAGALAEVARSEPAGLVPACRRLIDRHTVVGPMWWLAARVLTDAEPRSAAWRSAEELDDDPTPGALGRQLPDDAVVTVVGWPEVAAAALRRRGDLEVLAVDGPGDGSALARRLEAAGNRAAVVPDLGLAAAVANSELVLLEAWAAGPSGLLAPAGSHAAAAVGVAAGVPVWAVLAVGTVLPERMWQALLARLDARGDEPWDRAAEVVPAALVGSTFGPAGLEATALGLDRSTCPVAPELLRQAG